VFIADDILDGACLSDHVIRIFTEDIKMSYWMFAFFKSRAGVKLLQKTATGSMIPFITPDRLQELKFPKPDDNFAFVTNNIEKYLEKTVQSQLSENQAIDLIEKEIDQWQQL
jgi:type I restriction enzyme S subunit